MSNILELYIGSKIKVLMHLTKFSPYISNRSCTIYVPRYGIIPKGLGVRDLIIRGIPFVYVCKDFIEAYAGIFRPERMFYSINKSLNGSELNIIISDEIFHLLKLLKELKEPITLDQQALISFLWLGRVVGRNTLIKNIKLLDGGELLKINEDGASLEQCFSPWTPQTIAKSIEELEEEFMNVIMEVFKEYINVIKMENVLVIVPLSAGLDSRLVLSMIHVLGYRNVITLTYGLREAEYPVAKKVAEILGYENIFIEYTWDLWRKYLRDMLDYMAYASQLTTTPNIQEYVSTREFIKKCCDDVFKHTKILFVVGDISNIISGKEPCPLELLSIRNIKELVNFIVQKHVLFEPTTHKETALLKWVLFKFFKEAMEMKHDWMSLVTLYEVFHWKDRHFRYISSSRLPYIYYGLRYITPLWDGRIIKFLSSIPWQLRYKTNLYSNTLRKNLFRPLNIDIEDPTKRDIRITTIIPDVAKKLVPKTIVNLYGRYILSKIKNPCGFDVYFPRLFTLAFQQYERSKSDTSSNVPVDFTKTHLKLIPRDIIAFNTLTTLIMLNEKFLKDNIHTSSL